MHKEIDIKTNSITFTTSRFYPHPKGVYVPSVTTYLDAYPKDPHLIKWMKENGEMADEIKKDAGTRGNNVHHLTEDYDKGIECHLLDTWGNPKYTLEEWQMFERYVNFSERMQPVHHMIEQNFVCDILNMGGTIDRVSTVMGKNYIIDIKTSNGVYDTFFLQLAAYKRLYEKLQGDYGLKIDGVAVLWLNAKTRTEKEGQGVGWQLLRKETGEALDKDWEIFQHVQALWHVTNGKETPKKYTYKLTHKKHE